MWREKLLPVIDLKRGQVVQGVAGERACYQPVQSCLVESPHPARVAQAITNAIDVTDLYVADLDAIGGQEPDWNSFAAISQRGLRIWLDAGITDPQTARQLSDRVPSGSRLIAALETLVHLRSIEKVVEELPDSQCVFSLDLKRQVPLCRDPAASQLSAETIASYVIDAGIKSLIVLDLVAVGTNGGAMTLDLCRKIRSRFPEIELISGGGVRDWADVRAFLEAGCDRVLVSTSLHNGQLI